MNKTNNQNELPRFLEPDNMLPILEFQRNPADFGLRKILQSPRIATKTIKTNYIYI